MLCSERITPLQRLSAMRERRAGAQLMQAHAGCEQLAARQARLHAALAEIEQRRMQLCDGVRGLCCLAEVQRFRQRESALEHERLDLLVEDDALQREREAAQRTLEQARNARRASAARTRKLAHVAMSARHAAAYRQAVREDDELEDHDED